VSVQGVNAHSAFDISRVVSRIINDGVVAGPTVDGIIANATINSIITSSATDKVRQTVAYQTIVATTALYIFKISIDIN